MSRLNVDKITGKTGTNSGAPITLSGDTATLSGTGVSFPAGNIKRIYTKTLDSDLSLSAASTTVTLEADTHGITIPSVSSGDFLWCMFTGGRTRAANSGVGTNCMAWIVCNGNARARYFHYCLAGYDMGVSIMHLEPITANATNYVVKRGVSGNNTAGTVYWYCDSAHSPVEMAVFHIGSGIISDVSNT